MLTCYSLSHNRLIEIAELPRSDEVGAVVWIDLLSPSPEEDTWVETFLGVNIPSQAEMEEIELSDRLYREAGAEFMTLTALAKLDSLAPFKTPVTLILKNSVLVTVRYAELKPFAAYLGRAKRESSVPCENGELIIFGILEALIDRIADALEQIGNQVDVVARNVFEQRDSSAKSQQHDLEAVIKEIGRKSELLTMIQESLVSVARVATFHTPPPGATPSPGVGQMQILVDRDAASLGDHARALSGRMSFLLDATLGLINLQQNQIIKIVSVAALVFLPPTLVASIYGMNFHNIPELAWYYGYPLALGVMVLTAILPYLYFKKRGWL